jgi:hypothetical protein
MQYSVRVLTYSPIIFSAAIIPDTIAAWVHARKSKKVCSPANKTFSLPILFAISAKSFGEDPTGMQV